MIGSSTSARKCQKNFVSFYEFSSNSQTPNAPHAGQAGVYARATMRRAVRKSEKTRKCALGEHELSI